MYNLLKNEAWRNDPDHWETIVSFMDEDIREAVHADLAPCTDQEFLEEYEKRHLEQYGEEFIIN